MAAEQPDWNWITSDIENTLLFETASSATPVFAYSLYGNDESFDEFVAWASDSSNNPDYKDVYNSENFSGYAMNLYCSTSSMIKPDLSGCCMRTADDDCGGFCIIRNNESGTDFAETDTYRMSTAQFAT